MEIGLKSWLSICFFLSFLLDQSLIFSSLSLFIPDIVWKESLFKGSMGFSPKNMNSIYSST